MGSGGEKWDEATFSPEHLWICPNQNNKNVQSLYFEFRKKASNF